MSPGRLATDAVRGAAAGALATGPMSAVMLGSQKAGLMCQQPPEKITDAALATTGARTRSKEAEHALSTLTHFGFGAGAGALYGAVRRALPERVPSVTSGVAFALGVWAVSYKGWVPTLRIMPKPEHDRPGRPSAMISAHVVYGSALGVLFDRLPSVDQ